ncbi:MAG TPA: HD domain-containing protein [Gemmatimonadales bacterium]|jgi:HD superfamily phosphohydrolase|nr:HD domain-containing protein [Gemmatimonadales bacterium]
MAGRKGGPSDLEVIRDPLWDNIRLDRPAQLVLDTPAVQRLRYVRQLGHAFLVYPGATHTRFEHALGAYHLTRRALASLEERGELASVGPHDCLAVRLAALLHDIGHYPFSHALEEAGFPSHEAQGVAKLLEGELGDELRAIGGPGLARDIGELIRGVSPSPLQGLISGSLDLDKIDYLSRDARMCGVPYGTVDVDRLLSSLALVETTAGRRQVGVQEKGVSALESLLFAKYQMYRNVYWHHAVRAATCMFKRAARDAVRQGAVSMEAVGDLTDDGLMELLLREDRTGLAAAVRARRLFKRALDLPATEVAESVDSWAADDPDLVEEVEDALAREVGLEPGELLLDFPTRSSMLAVDLPLRTRAGGVEQLTDEGRAGQLGLPRVADELYRSARRLRIFAARPPSRDLAGAVALLRLPAAEVHGRLARGGALLSGQASPARPSA